MNGAQGLIYMESVAQADGTGTITITTLLFLYIAHVRWRWPLWAVVVGGGCTLPNAVTAATTLVVCSHVGWVSGELAPAELAELILDVKRRSGAPVAVGFGIGTPEQAAAAARYELAMTEIARSEGIDITEADVDAKYAELSKQYGLSVELLRQQLPPLRLRHDLKLAAAQAVVVDSAKRK